MTVPAKSARKTRPVINGREVIPKTRSNHVTKRKLASTIQKLYFANHTGTLRLLPRCFCIKSEIHAKGQTAHHNRPIKIKLKGKSAHQSVHVKVAPGFSE